MSESDLVSTARERFAAELPLKPTASNVVIDREDGVARIKSPFRGNLLNSYPNATTQIPLSDISAADTASQAAEELSNVPVEFAGPEPESLAGLEGPDSEATTTISGTAGQFVVNQDDGGPSPVFPDADAANTFFRRLSQIPDGVRGDLDPADLGEAPEIAERMAERRDRRETREAARDAAESAGVDLDEFGIDARADGTIVLQDRDTNQTRTIDPEGDLGDAIAEQTDGDSFDPTSSSSSNDTTSNVPSVDDLGGGRLAAAVAIGAAVLYGVTQS